MAEELLCEEKREAELEAILQERRIEAVFQPIVSLRRKEILLLEGLSRFPCGEGEEYLSPSFLFSVAEKRGLLLSLDRLCRDKVIQSFAKRWGDQTNYLLSVNFASSLIQQEIIGSDYLYRQVQEAGLPPHRLVLEIVESRIDDLDALQRFILRYREFGFLIALDDFGSGHSNLERIPLVHPDILKIDRSLLAGVDREYHKREVIKSIVGLAHRIGAIVIAEGVERAEEVSVAFEVGCDLFQGFYFAPPLSADLLLSSPPIQERIDRSIRYLCQARAEEEAKRRRFLHFALEITHHLAEILRSHPPTEAESIFRRFLLNHPEIECLYLLDRRGLQITDTILGEGKTPRIGGLFSPAARGADHSFKEYFLPLLAGVEEHVTEPYLSTATGSFCVTVSRRFLDAEGEARILCVDILLGEAP